MPYIYLDVLHSEQMIRDTIKSMDPKKFAYPVDGLIMEYEEIRYGKSLGATGHHENRLIALKWEDELYDTHFRGVELATTRTGMVSITGLFDPVNIDGTLVGRAYLHNLDVFDEFRFGIGDKIRVYKANMIIPQIADNRTQSNTYVLPMTCPCCDEPLTVKRTSGGTRQLYCVNPHCAAKLVQKFAHFCEKTRMNIEGLSATTLEKLIGHGWVHNFSDLYELERHREEIIKTEGFGEKSFERLQAAIEKAAAVRWQSSSPVWASPWLGVMPAEILTSSSMVPGPNLSQPSSMALISRSCRTSDRPCTTTFTLGTRTQTRHSSGVRCCLKFNLSKRRTRQWKSP